MLFQYRRTSARLQRKVLVDSDSMSSSIGMYMICLPTGLSNTSITNINRQVTVRNSNSERYFYKEQTSFDIAQAQKELHFTAMYIRKALLTRDREHEMHLLGEM